MESAIRDLWQRTLLRVRFDVSVGRATHADRVCLAHELVMGTGFVVVRANTREDDGEASAETLTAIEP